MSHPVPRAVNHSQLHTLPPTTLAAFIPRAGAVNLFHLEPTHPVVRSYRVEPTDAAVFANMQGNDTPNEQDVIAYPPFLSRQYPR